MTSNPRYRIALFASGRGSNAERILARFERHAAIRVALLLTSRADAPVAQVAERFGVPCRAVSRSQLYETDEALALLRAYRVTHIVLAGFIWLVPPAMVALFRLRIVNIHPALLPRYGGKGMYGMHVHRAVKAAGDTASGITIHHVDERYDTGEIIFQARCAIDPTDTPEQIAAKVRALEHRHYAAVVERWIQKP